MQVDSPEKIRNLAVAGHNDTGKTTLVSALLYAGNGVNRLGRVEDGNAPTDFGTAFVPWKGHKVNLIDCPGYSIFLTETKAGMRAADAVLLCVNPVAGVEVTTERVWSFAEELGLPATQVTNHLAWARRELRRLVLDRLRVLTGCEAEFREEAQSLFGVRVS